MTEVLDMGPLGVRVEITREGADALEYDVIGSPRGFLAQGHIHTRQVERLQMTTGAMRIVLDGSSHELAAGETIEIPAGVPHRHLGARGQSGVAHVTITPPGRTLEFLRELAALCAGGRVNSLGLPTPVALATLALEFADEGRASQPPAVVQRKLAQAVLGADRAWRAAGLLTARLRASAREGADREYVFVDEWDVAAPPQAVFEALADARTYPRWWRPVYIEVEAEGPPAVGMESRQHFKGRLPYHLHTSSRVAEMDPPRMIRGEVQGDLRGSGRWTLSELPAGTHVRFDWRVYADRPLLRALTPVLRPALRWNHDWAIARAMDGLEPYARDHARTAG